MAKKKRDVPKIPKEILGFRLSKGTRKDLRKLLKMIAHPGKRTMAMSAAAALSALLAQRLAEHGNGQDGRLHQAH
jgi:hypothetical protein